MFDLLMLVLCECSCCNLFFLLHWRWMLFCLNAHVVICFFFCIGVAKTLSGQRPWNIAQCPGRPYLSSVRPFVCMDARQTMVHGGAPGGGATQRRDGEHLWTETVWKQWLLRHSSGVVDRRSSGRGVGGTCNKYPRKPYERGGGYVFLSNHAFGRSNGCVWLGQEDEWFDRRPCATGAWLCGVEGVCLKYRYTCVHR